MKIKPKDIMVNLPAAHLFQSEDEMASFASAINTIIHGKVKIKYDVLGMLGGQYVGLFYIQRNQESKEINDEFRRLIEQEEISALDEEVASTNRFDVEAEDDHSHEEDWMKRPARPEDYYGHKLCIDCVEYEMLHQKGEDHCVCGETWTNGCRLLK